MDLQGVAGGPWWPFPPQVVDETVDGERLPGTEGEQSEHGALLAGAEVEGLPVDDDSQLSEHPNLDRGHVCQVNSLARPPVEARSLRLSGP